MELSAGTSTRPSGLPDISASTERQKFPSLLIHHVDGGADQIVQHLLDFAFEALESAGGAVPNSHLNI
jgi:hypothetical protein